MDKFSLGLNLIDEKERYDKIKIKPNICLLEKKDIFTNSKCIKFKLIDDNFEVTGDVIEINYWYQLKALEFAYLFYQAEKIYLPNKKFSNLLNEDLSNKFIYYQDEIKYLPKVCNQIYISEKISHVSHQIKNKFNLIDYYDINKSAYFFGIYNRKDISKLIDHKSDSYIIFGGSDLDYNMFHCKVLIPKLIEHKDKIRKFFVISENLKNRAIQLNLPKNKIELIRLDLTSDEDFKINNYGNTIYVYDGCFKTGKLYRREIAEQVINKLPETFSVIYSSELSLPPDEMYSIYKKCFIGLRLTEKDGNANTVLEMGKMGIPVIFNGNEVNRISYNSVDDIVSKILDWYNITLNMFD